MANRNGIMIHGGLSFGIQGQNRQQAPLDEVLLGGYIVYRQVYNDTVIKRYYSLKKNARGFV
jgi:hypothetical protein